MNDDKSNKKLLELENNDELLYFSDIKNDCVYNPDEKINYFNCIYRPYITFSTECIENYEYNEIILF